MATHNNKEIADISLEDAASEPRNFNHDTTSVKKTFPVLGMTCASCAGSAESIVAQAPGVLQAAVNFATGNLTVEFSPAVTDPYILQKTVQSVGFDLLIEEESTQQETLEAIHEKKYQALKSKTIWAIILSLPVVIIGMFFMDMPYGNEIMWAFSTPVVFWLGKDFLSTPGSKLNFDPQIWIHSLH